MNIIRLLGRTLVCGLVLFLSNQALATDVSGYGQTVDEALINTFDQCVGKRIHEFKGLKSGQYGHTATIDCGPEPEVYDKRIPYYTVKYDVSLLYYEGISGCESWKKDSQMGEARLTVTPMASIEYAETTGYIVLCTLTNVQYPPLAMPYGR
jgi:hypothetical protein